MLGLEAGLKPKEVNLEGRRREGGGEEKKGGGGGQIKAEEGGGKEREERRREREGERSWEGRGGRRRNSTCFSSENILIDPNYLPLLATKEFNEYIIQEDRWHC